LNIIIINYHHPEENIVGAIRTREFSRYLAAQGHKVMVISRGVSASLNKNIGLHKWNEPFYLGVTYEENVFVDRARKGKGRRIINKFILAYAHFVFGGSYMEWEKEVKSTRVKELIIKFQPDCIWAIFGSTNCVSIGNWICTFTKAHFFIDIKDPWMYVPAVFRIFLNQRINGKIKGITTNSHMQWEKARMYFPNVSHCVVYSGCNTKWIKELRPEKNTDHSFVIHLVGSVYSTNDLQNFFLTLGNWAGALKKSNHDMQLCFEYSGINPDIVDDHVYLLSDHFKILVHGQVSHQAFLKRCKSATINCYMWTATRSLFHHKTIELMACGKPIISYPGEWDETIQIGKECNAVFFSCKNQTELFDSIEAIYNKDIDAGILNTNILDWEYYGKDLEIFLIKNK